MHFSDDDNDDHVEDSWLQHILYDAQAVPELDVTQPQLPPLYLDVSNVVQSSIDGTQSQAIPFPEDVKPEVSSTCYGESFSQLAGSSFTRPDTPNSTDDAPLVQMQRPLLVLSMSPWPGPHNFTMSVFKPPTDKSKWCISPGNQKVFVQKNVAFPIRISVNQWLPSAVVVICPVYVEGQFRMESVTRCLNCSMSDRNAAVKDHVVQIDGKNPIYFQDGERYMVAVPLGMPAPGETFATIYAKMGCRTSCVGGPNRRPFSLVLTLLFNNEEVGRQVVDLKCCESPDRDMKTENKNLSQRNQSRPDDRTQEKINEIAAGLMNKTGKRKQSQKMVANTPVEYEMIRVPKKHVKQVKKYVSFLQYCDCSPPPCKRECFSSGDSES